MRGKPSKTLGRSKAQRITPADAGKTYHTELFSGKLEDHPRGCGENLFLLVFLYSPQGSPPRMRGKPKMLYRVLAVLGITPADAGKTDKAKT